jgi:predicted NBD/HSP70 family sugar kinase
MPRSSPARPALLRQLNDRTVLEVLLAEGATSRGDLAARTGLSKPTVTEVVGRLEESGLLVDGGETVGRPGPNGRRYDVDPTRCTGVGLTVEPRGVRAELVDARGTVLASATDPRGASGSATATAAALVTGLVADAGIRRSSVHDVVIAVPGSYDAESDQVRHADRVPAWTSPGLSAAITAALGTGTRLAIDNDANLALVAESAATSDAARTRALLWLGAGIGLAAEIDGRPYRGASGGAGEIGYVPVPTDGPATRTQAEFQDVAGSAAVLKLAGQHGIKGRTAADAVARAAAEGGSASAAFLDELATRVAIGLTIVVAVLDPGVVVLGGSTGRAGGPDLARRTERALRTRSRLRCAVVPSAVDGDPVLTGARVVAARRSRERLLAAASIPQQQSDSSTSSTTYDRSSLPRTAEEARS